MMMTAAIADSGVVRAAAAAANADADSALPAFDGFQDFDLDLTCLSPPASPPASVYEDARARARSVTPPASPRHSLALSFRSASPTRSRRSRVSQTKSASPLLQNQGSAPAVPRGSWPLVRYVGRGTPVDRSRRIEWGAASAESDAGDDDVGEDGVFFTAASARAPSIDSTATARSVSPDWNILSRRASTVPARAASRALRPRPSPAIQIEGLGSEKPGEWASFVHTAVLGSAAAPAASTSQAPPAPAAAPAPAASEDPEAAPPAAGAPSMTPEQMQQLDAELGIDLGIDGALDLGLGHEGMNWFNLGMLPASRGATPSVYSSHAPTTQTQTQTATPRPSRPPSAAGTLREAGGAKGVAADGGQAVKPKAGKSASPVWWRRMMQGLKKVPLLMVGSR